MPSLRYFSTNTESLSWTYSKYYQKSLEIFKTFLKKDFKLWLYNKSNILFAVFILALSKVDSIIEKWEKNQNMINLSDF